MKREEEKMRETVQTANARRECCCPPGQTGVLARRKLHEENAASWSAKWTITREVMRRNPHKEKAANWNARWMAIGVMAMQTQL